MDLWQPFSDTFNGDKLLVFKTDHWSVLVRKHQVTLGSLVLAANRNFISASELRDAELEEFPEVVGKLEFALEKVFRFDKINYLCLMMSDQHYHFHVIPRYEGARQFLGREWIDSNWPGPPGIIVPETDSETLFAIRSELKLSMTSRE